jgi:formylglycine-generating enzyme required for sulfatase activity
LARFVRDTSYRTDAEKDGEGGWGWTGEDFAHQANFNWQETGFAQNDEHPVVNVSWNDAVAFCDWLSAQEGKSYRLPTEAHWEYACRAGTTTRYYDGNDADGLARIGNVADATAKAEFAWWTTTISARDGYEFTAPAGQFQANRFGLYDMTGNVWEWCADWYDSEYYDNSPTDDPEGPASGSYRVFRGGGWNCGAVLCRSSLRYNYEPTNRSDNIGFRVLLVPSGQ